MSTKITVIFENPTDPKAFERAYPALLEQARAIGNVKQIESSKVWPKEDGTVTPAYRMIDLYMADYDAASNAVTTPEAGKFFTDAFALATGGARALFSELERD